MPIIESHTDQWLGDEWSDCFRLENVTLPTNPYIGLTAMTGDVSDAHEYVPRLEIHSTLPDKSH